MACVIQVALFRNGTGKFVYSDSRSFSNLRPVQNYSIGEVIAMVIEHVSDAWAVVGMDYEVCNIVLTGEVPNVHNRPAR